MNSNTDTRTIGLFVKTCKPDLSWLFHALQTFKNNWQDWDRSKLLVVADPDCQDEINSWQFPGPMELRIVEPWPCGYCHAMATKLCADLYLPECTPLLLFDSDMMLTRPASLNDLMPSAHPVISYDFWHTDLDQSTREVSKQVWRPAVRRSMGLDLDRDWMVSPTWLFWPSTFHGARNLIEAHCRAPFLQAVYCNHLYDWHRFTEHPFTLCDIQALGLFASMHEQHKYQFQRRSSDHPQREPIYQNWSHAIEANQK